VAVEMRDVAPGLWLWRQPHPDWPEGSDWKPEVASFAVESRGVACLLDPLAPPPSARDVWARIDALSPTTVVVLKPDHVRDVDLFVRWYGATAFGPQMFWRDEVPARSCSRFTLATTYPAGFRPITTAVASWKRPSTCPSSVPWCSPTA
jgi:hypothetical protein